MNQDFYHVLPDEKSETKTPSQVIVTIDPIRLVNPLIDYEQEWYVHIIDFLRQRDLMRLMSTCRFFQHNLVNLSPELAKYQIVKLSVILAKDYAGSKIVSQLSSRGEGAEYTDLDRENEKAICQASVARLLSNDSAFLGKLKWRHKKTEICFKIGVPLYLFLTISALIYMIYDLIATQGKDTGKDLAYGSGIFMSLLVLFICFKCGLHRGLTQNRGEIMIDKIEHSFNQFRLMGQSPAVVFPATGAICTELRELNLLSRL